MLVESKLPELICTNSFKHILFFLKTISLFDDLQIIRNFGRNSNADGFNRLCRRGIACLVSDIKFAKAIMSWLVRRDCGVKDNAPRSFVEFTIVVESRSGNGILKNRVDKVFSYTRHIIFDRKGKL